MLVKSRDIGCHEKWVPRATRCSKIEPALAAPSGDFPYSRLRFHSRQEINSVLNRKFRKWKLFLCSHLITRSQEEDWLLMSKNGYVCVFVWSLLHGNAVVIKTTCLNGREMPKSVLSHFIMSVLKKERSWVPKKECKWIISICILLSR